MMRWLRKVQFQEQNLIKPEIRARIDGACLK